MVTNGITNNSLTDNKMRTGTYKILPQYSELDEKSTR
jgi:hypothetical protein